MNVLVCVKRVPETGARISLTPDAQAVDDSFLGHTISPHEECAVEEALRLAAAHGGTTTVLTLGPPAAAEQLRDAVAMGVDAAILLETDGGDWDPQATAAAIADAVRGRDFDLLLFGNESADSGGYQVGIRVAYLLGLPVVTGAKGIELGDGVATVRREAGGGWEIFETPAAGGDHRARGDQPAALPLPPGAVEGEEDGDPDVDAGASGRRAWRRCGCPCRRTSRRRSWCSARAPRRRHASSRCCGSSASHDPLSRRAGRALP